MIPGIDVRTLLSKNEYQLDENQFKLLLDNVFKKSKFEAEKINRYVTLAINKFSIDINGKQYVVAYRPLTINFKNMTLENYQKLKKINENISSSKIIIKTKMHLKIKKVKKILKSLSS